MKEKIEALQAELQAVSKSKSMLEKELQEVINVTSTELEEYQEKVLELEDEVKRCFNYIYLNFTTPITNTGPDSPEQHNVENPFKQNS